MSTMLRENLIDNYGALVPEDVLSSFRDKAIQKANELGLPHKKTENYLNFKLNKIYQYDYKKASLNHQDLEDKINNLKVDSPSLVFYQGRFLPRLSNLENLNSRLVIKPLSDAIYSYGAFIKGSLDQFIKNELDVFALLSFAHHIDGSFIYFPKDLELESEIAIINITDTCNEEVVSSFNLMSLGQNASAKINTYSIELGKSNSLINNSWHFQLEANSNLEQSHLVLDQSITSFDHFRILQKRDSTYKSIQINLEANLHRASYQSLLLESGAHVEFIGACCLKGNQEAFQSILIKHLAPNCTSSQLFKNILDDKSVASFEGKIFVLDIAQQTNAYQLNQNCLLSDTAKCFSKPNLEIFADDVKASHGSTTGQLDCDQMFYLQSRGLSRVEAQIMLLKAFFEDIVNSISSDSIKQKVLEKFSQSLVS